MTETARTADISVLANARGQAALVLPFDPGPVARVAVLAGGGSFAVEAADGRRLGTLPASAWPDVASARETFLAVVADGVLETRPVAVDLRSPSGRRSGAAP